MKRSRVASRQEMRTEIVMIIINKKNFRLESERKNQHLAVCQKSVDINIEQTLIKLNNTLSK